MKCKWVGKIVVWMGLGFAVLLSAGCLSNHGGSSSLAYREIKNADPEVVHQSTIRVFRENYYQLSADDGAGRMVFEREATQRDRTRWARYGEQGMVMRVEVKMEPLVDNVLLRADAYIMRPRGAEKITHSGRRPYRSLLKKVDKTVKKEMKKK